jgi:hypothetical protein
MLLGRSSGFSKSLDSTSAFENKDEDFLGNSVFDIVVLMWLGPSSTVSKMCELIISDLRALGEVLALHLAPARSERL